MQWTSQNTSHPDHVCDNHLTASHICEMDKRTQERHSNFVQIIFIAINNNYKDIPWVTSTFDDKAPRITIFVR